MNKKVSVKKRYIVYIALVCFLLILFIPRILYSPSSVVTPTITPAAKAEWLISVLKNPVCQPPCWERITPGETSIDEAYYVLQELVYVRNIKFHKAHKLARTIEWDFNHFPDWGKIESDYSGLIVDFTSLIFHDQLSLTLDEFIAEYGTPDYVEIYRWERGAFCEIFLVNDQLGVNIGLEPQPCKHSSPLLGETSLKTTINQGTYISSITFFYDKTETLVVSKSEYAIDWHGYGEYKIIYPKNR